MTFFFLPSTLFLVTLINGAVNVLRLLEGRCAQLGVRLASVKNLGFQIETGLLQDKANDLKNHRLTTALPV